MLIACILRKGSALIYDKIRPCSVLGYILPSNHTPKLVHTKKKPTVLIPASNPFTVLLIGFLLPENLCARSEGIRKPLQVKMKIFVLPISKSLPSIMKKMSQKLVFLPT